MLFASVQLAARIERADCRLLIDAAEAIRMRTQGDVINLPIGGGVAIHTGLESPMNKIAGLGFAGPVDEAALANVEEVWAQCNTPVQVELSCLADPSVGTMLTRRGYELRGFENVLGRAIDTMTTESERTHTPTLKRRGATDVQGQGIDVRASGARELALWTDVVVTGFMTPDTQGAPSHEQFPRAVLERVFGEMADTTGMVRYLAWIGGEAVGGASMKMFEGVAQLAGAATLPAFRRRGVQSALLHTRLTDAASAGCDIATVTTLPGSKSHENVQRRGFELLYTRAVLVR